MRCDVMRWRGADDCGVFILARVTVVQALTSLMTISVEDATASILQLFNALMDVVGCYTSRFKPVALPGYSTTSTVTIVSAAYRLLVSLLDKLHGHPLLESYLHTCFWRPGVYKVRCVSWRGVSNGPCGLCATRQCGDGRFSATVSLVVLRPLIDVLCRAVVCGPGHRCCWASSPR